MTKFSAASWTLIYAYKLQDTYRGRICECPVVDGVQYQGDGYMDCKGTVLHFYH